MPWLTRSRVLGLLGLVAGAVLWKSVYIRFGDAAGDRVWGIGLLVVAIAFIFIAEIPVSMGSRTLTPLRGWKKSYVVVPALVIGLAVALYPHEVACTLHLRNRVCP